MKKTIRISPGVASLDRTAATLAAGAMIACAVALVSAGHAQTAGAKPSAPGRVTNLGQTRPPQVADQAMLAHYRLFQQSHTEAIEALRDGNVKQFVAAYREIASSVTEITDLVAGGHESLGEAEASAELLGSELKLFMARGGDDGEARRLLIEDVKAFRDTLATQLDTLRQRYLAANPNDQDQRLKLRKQMAVVVGQIEHFEKLQTSADGGGAALADAAAVATQTKLQEMGEALAREQAALRLTAGMLRTKVAETMREMERSFRLIELQTRLPKDQLRRLVELQQKSEQVMQKLVGDHQRATDGFLAILASGDEAPVPDEPELMARVAKALGEAGPEAKDEAEEDR